MPQTDLATLISTSSSAPIDTAFVRLKAAGFHSSSFIQPTNAYFSDPAGKVDTQSQKQQTCPITDAPDDLLDYLAATSILHCFDGWSYLGRSLFCHLIGDLFESQHLAYYAELRAAMSILARAGIGCFNRHHAIFNGSGAGSTHNLATHDFVACAIQHWSKRTDSGDGVCGIISADGVTLADWLSEFGAGFVNSSVAASWLASWGVDLKAFKGDRDARNFGSYRARTISARYRLAPAKALRFVTDFWKLMEPSASTRFPALDQYLIRNAFEASFRLTAQTTRVEDPAKYRQLLDNLLQRLNFSPEQAAKWRIFMMREGSTSRDPLLLSFAARDAVSGGRIGHLPVVARAALMLRLASGYAAAGLQAGNIVSTDVSNWSNASAHLWGLVSSSVSISDFTELWADIAEHLENADKVEVRLAMSGADQYELLATPESSYFAALTSTERIALWGIGL